jgi:MFS family permease
VWNPMAVFGWSFLFGPLFGAILLERNWRHLRLEEQGRKARYFLWGCTVFFICIAATLFVDFEPQTDKAVQGLLKIAGLVLTGLCGSLARSQRGYLKDVLGGTCLKRSWLKPLSIGFGILVPFVAVIVLGATQGPLMCWLVEREARPLLVQEFARRPDYVGISIQSVKFDHHAGPDYDGNMVIRTASGMSNVPLKAHLEGNRLSVNWPNNLSGSTGPQ